MFGTIRLVIISFSSYGFNSASEPNPIFIDFLGGGNEEPSILSVISSKKRPTRRFPLLGTGKPVGGKMGPCYGGHSPGSYSGIDSSATCSGQTLSACRYKFSNKKGLRNNEQRLLTRQMVSLLVSLTLLKEIKENRH